MITNYNTYLLLEKTNLNKLHLSQQFIKKLYSKLNNDYLINNYFTIDKIENLSRIKDILIQKNSVLVKKEDSVYVFLNITKNNTYVLANSIIYSISNSSIKKFIDDNKLEEDSEIYLLTNFIIRPDDKSAKLYRININNIEDYFNFNYKSSLIKYYQFLLNYINKRLEDKVISKIYKIELEEDQHTLKMLTRNIFSYCDIRRLVEEYTKSEELKEYKLDSEEIANICKYMLERISNINNSYLKITKYKKWKNKIQEDPSLYKEYKDMINDPELKELFKHLENSTNFDLI
jgi:hypothetical protein